MRIRLDGFFCHRVSPQHTVRIEGKTQVRNGWNDTGIPSMCRTSLGFRVWDLGMSLMCMILIFLDCPR